MTSTALTRREKRDLERLEDAIAKGIGAFHEVGLALIEVRDRQLYREQYGRFEDYCNERWGFKHSQAYRLIGAAEVMENLSPNGGNLPKNERQTRPLQDLDPESQRLVWDAASANGTPPSASHLDAIKAKVLASASSKPTRAAEQLAGLSATEKAATINAAEADIVRHSQRNAAKDRKDSIERLCRKLVRIHAGLPDVADEADAALEGYLSVIRSSTEDAA